MAERQLLLFQHSLDGRFVFREIGSNHRQVKTPQNACVAFAYEKKLKGLFDQSLYRYLTFRHLFVKPGIHRHRVCGCRLPLDGHFEPNFINLFDGDRSHGLCSIVHERSTFNSPVPCCREIIERKGNSYDPALEREYTVKDIRYPKRCVSSCFGRRLI